MRVYQAVDRAKQTGDNPVVEALAGIGTVDILAEKGVRFLQTHLIPGRLHLQKRFPDESRAKTKRAALTREDKNHGRLGQRHRV